ncbi:unnamed protein product [Blepharisma stoltei]|uniref:Tubulin-tyrosine ligase family protein n=1 Tax=Blepharisma stoltei TaxID=1481888 RepID=A0AAU9JZN8_9CILI|nr:unnamed protein product [Blepharisma stoltei]
MSIRKSVQSQHVKDRPKIPSVPQRKQLSKLNNKTEITKGSLPNTKPKLSQSPEGHTNLDDKEIINAVKSIYSPKVAEKQTHRNPRIYSKISIFKGRRIITENIDSPILINRKTGANDENFTYRTTVIPKHFEIDLSAFRIQKNGMVSLKEAMRDKSWLGKAKEFIQSELSSFINASNGIIITHNESNGGLYKYFLGKGNNHPLVKQCFNSRWWWSQAEEEQSPGVNMSWTQLKSQEFINSIPIIRDRPENIENIEKRSIDCKIFYESEVLEEKSVDISPLGYDIITKSSSYVVLSEKLQYIPHQIKCHNRLEFNSNLSDKKFLYMNMKKYYSALRKNVFNYLPLTFHIKFGEEDPEFIEFLNYFQELKSSKQQNLWILKPGENTNRGNGICVCDTLEKITQEVRNNPFPKTGEHTFIIQKYLDRPYLINKRKFDIRLYTLVTATNGIIQAYFYQEGYLRTACKEYSPKNLDNKFIHLTNDAVQKKSEDYGKFENGNKISYMEFQRYIENRRPKVNINFFDDVLPAMKDIVKDTIQAVYMKISKNNRAHTFEIYGYDFLLDSNLKPWLLEVNTNPCLELSSPILARIIPAMLENAFKIALDPLFPEPHHISKKAQVGTLQDHLPENKFELIFHEKYDGAKLLERLESLGTLNIFMSAKDE